MNEARNVIIIGGPEDGLVIAAEPRTREIRVIEQGGIDWGKVIEDPTAPVPTIIWAIPVRRDGTAHWRDRRRG